ncbi:MAG TPA: hypothetical protein VK508_21670 [Cyclobacteriaceae bacterium]|nr:hypothetical protein [Cyclobacteriaceae bacterium]
MKHFTEPSGRFVIQIPTEWQYKNVAAGIGEVSPFSFELYENSVGCFQISCYSKEEKPINTRIRVQKFDQANLEFLTQRMDGGGFNMHLWYATIEDHMIMAKYIYETTRADEIKAELQKAEVALASLELLSPEKRALALDIDKYEKFMASLAASFDLRNKAMESMSLIELTIIIANQIDAYLRMSIVLYKQLREISDAIDISLLFQAKADKPIMERTIYKQANELGIINGTTFDRLENLYSERNKVVHRYIISDLRTSDMLNIVKEYETISESVRLELKKLEETQAIRGLGIHKNGRRSHDELTSRDLNFLYSQVNDKHLTKDFYRQISDKN